VTFAVDGHDLLWFSRLLQKKTLVCKSESNSEIRENMLLVFIAFIFFILHIQFLVRYLLFGTNEAEYYGFYVRYLFSKNIALQSLIFTVLCLLFFTVGYKIFYKRSRTSDSIRKNAIQADTAYYNRELLVFYVVGWMQVVIGLTVGVVSKFNYTAMVTVKENYPFVFQLRGIFLFILAHLLLNIPWKQFVHRADLMHVRVLVVIYGITTILCQARSEVFEVVSVTIFSFIMWNGDRVKIKYILAMFLAIIAPNLIVLGRLGFPTDLHVIQKNLFSFEYSILFNNYLSEAILQGRIKSGEITFIPSLVLVIPSPIRSFLGIEVIKSYVYDVIAFEVDSRGGGFSMLAEMFANFGWYGAIVFLSLGMLVGKFNQRASQVGNVSLIYSAAPQIYIYLVLTFRNDFGVFIKQLIQAFVLAALIDGFCRLRFLRK